VNRIGIWIVLLGAAASFARPAQAMSSDVTVTAERVGNLTRFHVKVCVCMTGAEVIAYNAAGGGGQVRVNFTEDVCVTENDFWVDDSDLICVSKGVYAEPFAWAHGQGCPPAPAVCKTVHTTGWISSSSYGSENPGDFQLGEMGEEEGDVPSGTTVLVTTTGLTDTPEFPNSSS